MKIRPEDYQQLRNAIQAVRAMYPEETVEAAEKRGWTAKRWRWQLVHVAQRLHLLPYFTSSDDGFPLYSYLNDDHIDTALRRITGTK